MLPRDINEVKGFKSQAMDMEIDIRFTAFIWTTMGLDKWIVSDYLNTPLGIKNRGK